MTIRSIGSQSISSDPATSSQSNQTVAEVQQALNRINQRTELEETGVFDRHTEDALRDFQNTHGIAATGTINQETINALNRGVQQQETTTPEAPIQISEAERNRRMQELRTPDLVTRPQLESQLGETRPTFEQISNNITDRRIPATERERFSHIEAANDRTESGGSTRASVLGTTAGEPASIGSGQLLTRLQVDGAARQLNDRQSGSQFGQALQANGVTQESLQNIRSHGQAAMSWYDLTATDSRVTPAATHDAGLSPGDAENVRNLASQGRVDDIMNNPEYVRSFESQTGLPASELRTMCNSRGLQTGEYRTEFQNNQRSISSEITAANDWTRMMNTNQAITPPMLQHTGLTREQADRVRDLSSTGRGNEIAHDPELLRRFNNSTGMRASDLEQMASMGTQPRRAAENAAWLQNATRANGDLQDVLERNPRLANNPQRMLEQATLLRMSRSYGHPELRSMAENPNLTAREMARQGAAEQVIQSHPDLQQVTASHEGRSNRLDREDVLFYLERGRTNENRNGWWTRGAEATGQDWERFRNALPNVDVVTNRQRSIDNFEHARSVTQNMQGFDQLSPREQERITGQIARVSHYGPQAFNNNFGAANAPRSVEEYNAWLANQRETHSDLSTAIDSWTRNYDALYPAEQAEPALAGTH